MNTSTDNPDVWLFAGLFVLGVVTELLLRLVWDVAVLLVTALLVGYLIVYAVIVYRKSYTTLSSAQAADNFYYLGFLYTVVALAIALYKFSASDSQGIVLRLIIGDLGIGLSTTIVGLFLRVMFSQFRNSPEEIESRVSIRLKHRASDVERQFISTINLFSRINYRIIDLAEKTEETIQNIIGPFPSKVQAINDNVTRGVRNAVERIPEATESSVRELETLTGDLNQRIAKVIAQIDASALERSINKTAESFHGLEVFVQDLHGKSTIVANEMDNLASGIRKAYSEINLSAIEGPVGKTAKSMEELQYPVFLLNEKLTDMIAALDILISRIKNTGPEVDMSIMDDPIIRVGEKITSMETSLSKLDKNIHLLSENLENFTKELAQFRRSNDASTVKTP